MKKHLPIIIALAALIFVPLVSITHSKYKKAAAVENMHTLVRVQNREADVLIDIIENLKLNLRTVAYHQAVLEMENAFPLEYRSGFTSEEWEDMISRKTDQILETASTVQLNPDMRLSTTPH